MQDSAVTSDEDGNRRSEGEQTTADVTAFGQIGEPMLSLLYAYWDGKRGDRRFPGRRRSGSRRDPGLLPSIFLVTVHRDPFDLVSALPAPF